MRIIAGTLKGRVLKAPKGNRTRPTADRVKEALFSILGVLDERNVLDLYAGTGALGIEALSRGARRAIFVEASHESMKCLMDNLRGLNLTDRSRAIHSPVERARNEIARNSPFDLVFCDPPWSKTVAVWELLVKTEVAQYLAPEGLLVLEHPATEGVNTEHWRELGLVLTRAWGDSAITILQKRASRTNAEHPTTHEPDR